MQFNVDFEMMSDVEYFIHTSHNQLISQDHFGVKICPDKDSELARRGRMSASGDNECSPILTGCVFCKHHSGQDSICFGSSYPFRAII